MLRRCGWFLSLASERPSAFSQTALQLLALQQQHSSLMASADGSRTNVEASLREVERDVEDLVDRLRVVYSTTTGMQSSRFYSQRVRSALVYFGMKEDPLCQSIDLQLGRFAESRPENRPRRTAIKQYHAGSTATSSANVRRDPLEAADLQFNADELPAPAPELLRKANAMPGKSKFHDRERGHWILRDDGIATTKEQRKFDPW